MNEPSNDAPGVGETEVDADPYITEQEHKIFMDEDYESPKPFDAAVYPATKNCPAVSACTQRINRIADAIERFGGPTLAKGNKGLWDLAKRAGIWGVIQAGQPVAIRSFCEIANSPSCNGPTQPIIPSRNLTESIIELTMPDEN